MREETSLLAPLDERTVHVCVDMQRLFAQGTDWAMPWFERVLPNVQRIVGAWPRRTLFTRFVPARAPGDGHGTWRRYYERWPSMTRERLADGMIDVVPELGELAPAAPIVDKAVYSPWLTGRLDALLRDRSADTVVITGGETDVCVLATVLGAVDHGYRVVIVTDALCSSSDETHDAMMTLYHNRYSQQVEAATTEQVLEGWLPKQP
ncbi:cysteine hydrolase family protein [Chelatococcus reniformis]|uniref:Isochorismatase-like domain-containing protein n=1 Tax=Chelatococcus reniformis TaxID=1494448 RepID=A0A916UQU8_9HYPH|nr:isochorismatase family cysteine hydrolase [Chelatococcus reniformis]GGC83752.1 hypothetical protein GCM10010994_47060 [Chelatococcus reniformis]